MIKTIAILFVIIFWNASSFAQFPKVDIPGSQSRKINSAIVNQEYELHILLPGGYEKSTKKYPVVYLMDSQWDFPLVKSIYGQQYYDGFIPEMIIVGVTWGGVKPNPDSLRARDYTPTNEKRMIQSGGADKFLSFMKDELFPFIEKNYKADNTGRTLMGCSFGGLITMYAMLTHTEMFNGYAAASPAIGWDNEVLYQYEKIFAAKKLTNPVRLYMTVGDVERSRPVFERFADQLINRNHANVSIRSKVLENTGHSGTKSETYSRGLQFIFERSKLNLDSAILNKYTGTYQLSNGNTIELKNENNQLVFYFSPTNKYGLYAATESDFYSTAEFFNTYFTEGGMRLERFGSNQFLKRIK